MRRFVVASLLIFRQRASNLESIKPRPVARVNRAVVAIAILAAVLIAPTAASATGESTGGESSNVGGKTGGIFEASVESIDPRVLDGELPSDTDPSTESPNAGAMTLSNGGCTHKGNSDRVHWSKTQPGAVSSHGWWEDESNGGCEGVKATVTVELQRYVCRYYWGIRVCDYETIETNSRRNLWPGGGSSNWTPVHYMCVGNITVTWRTRVDVDLQGRADHWGKFIPENSYANLDCSTY